MAENIVNIISYREIFGILTLLGLFLLIRYNQKIDPENIINYLLYLTNKLLLFVFTITSFLIFILSFSENIVDKIRIFINETFLNMLYFMFVMYGVFGIVKFIYYLMDYAKENDLFGKSFLDKLNLNKKKWIAQKY